MQRDCVVGRVRRSVAGTHRESREDGDQGAGLELVGDGGDFAEASRFSEGADEARALRLRAAEARPLGDHDGPGEDAREQKDDEDREGDGAAVMNHLH